MSVFDGNSNSHITLLVLVQKFISEYDDSKDINLFNQVMQAHPVFFLQKTVEAIINDS